MSPSGALAEHRGALIAFFLAYGASIVGSLVVFRLAAVSYDQAGLAIYALSRRVFTLLHPLFALGLGLAVAKRAAECDEAVARSYLRASVAVALGWSGLLVGAMLLVPRPFAALFLGSERYGALVAPLGLMLFGCNWQLLLFSFLRGRMLFVSASGAMAFNLGLVPVAAFAFTDSVAANLLFVGAVWSLELPVVLVLQRRATGKVSVLPRQLLSLGLPRALAELGQILVLTLPVVFVAHQWGAVRGGIFALAIAIVNNLSYAFAGLSAPLLPIATRAVAAGSHSSLRDTLVRVVGAIASGGVVLVGVLWLFGPALTRLYLGRSIPGLAALLQVTSLAVVPLAVYHGTRGALDGVTDRALNLRNVSLALVILSAGGAIGMVLGGSIVVHAVVFVCAAVVLGVQSVRSGLIAMRPAAVSWPSGSSP